MKVLLLLVVSLIVSAFGQECTFQTIDANGVVYFFDVSELSLESGQVSYGFDDIENARFWVFNLCGELDGLSNYFEIPFSCTPGSAACFQSSFDKSPNWTSSGSASDFSFGHSMFGIGQGISITYFNGDECSSPGGGYAYRQVRFELVCDVNAQQISAFGNTIISDDCYNTIVINTSAACPGISQSSGNTPSSEPTLHNTSFSFFMWMYGPISAFLLVCCICCAHCCWRRNRRCSTQRKSTYEPVPQRVPEVTEVVSQQPIPNMIPLQNYPVPQLYFFPQASPALPAPVKQDEQLIRDAELAKQLQAQYDREGSN